VQSQGQRIYNTTRVLFVDDWFRLDLTLLLVTNAQVPCKSFSRGLQSMHASNTLQLNTADLKLGVVHLHEARC